MDSLHRPRIVGVGLREQAVRPLADRDRQVVPKPCLTIIFCGVEEKKSSPYITPPLDEDLKKRPLVFGQAAVRQRYSPSRLLDQIALRIAVDSNNVSPWKFQNSVLRNPFDSFAIDREMAYGHAPLLEKEHDRSNQSQHQRGQPGNAFERLPPSRII